MRFRDPQLERAWQHANKVITKQIPLLVLGETGVGKEQFVKNSRPERASHRAFSGGELRGIACRVSRI